MKSWSHSEQLSGVCLHASTSNVPSQQRGWGESPSSSGTYRARVRGPEDGWRCLGKWCIITLWWCSPSLEGVSSVSFCMDIWGDGVCVRVCVCVCVRGGVKCWCYVDVAGARGLGGGWGSSLLVAAISARAHFHLKEHSAPLFLPFSTSPPMSASSIFLTPLPPLFSFSPLQCSGTFTHALLCQTRDFTSFFPSLS